MKNSNIKNKGLSQLAKGKLVFYILGLSIFVVQFLVYYVYANFSSITLAFQKLVLIDGNSKYIFNGFENFKEIFTDFSQPNTQSYIFRGILIFIMNMPTLFIASFFSYYIARRFPAGKLFQVMLYIPGIISGLVFTSMYKYFMCDCIPAIWKSFTGETILPLIDPSNTVSTFICTWLYSFILSFGGGVLYITSSMASISQSVVEAVKIEGAKPFKEFTSIYFPLSWQIISISFITSFAGFLTADVGLFTFFGTGAPEEIWTLGYYMNLITVNSTQADYPYIAALGLLISAITIPVTLASRRISDKISKRWE